MNQGSFRVVFAILIATFLTSHILVANARYLPTRSQDDRLEKLREHLKDLLEGDLERRPVSVPGMEYGDVMGAGQSRIYKRSIEKQHPFPLPMFPDRLV